MGQYFHSFLTWSLGDHGRYILDLIIQNKLIFIFIFAIYAFVLLYSKIILYYYLPFKIKQCITTYLSSNKMNSYEDMQQFWLNAKALLPWFILVPSRNELWITRLSNNTAIKTLKYNAKIFDDYDEKILKQLYQKYIDDIGLYSVDMITKQ